MSFTADSITNKVYRYTTNQDPITIKEEIVRLQKKPGEKYGVGSKKILVKVHSISINPIDIVLYNSAYSFLSWYGERGICMDYSGTIVDIGDKAIKNSGFQIGDEVVGMTSGGKTAGQYLLIDSSSYLDSAIAKKPKNLTMNEAASFPMVFGTAYSMLDSHKLQDKKVLILGGGTSVGRYLIQLAKLKGSKIIVTTNSERSNEMVTSLGSDFQIDYHNPILGPLVDSVLESGKFDYIYDACGNKDLLSHLQYILKSRVLGSAYVSCVGDSKFNYNSDHIALAFLRNTMPIIKTMTSKLGLTDVDYKYMVLFPSKKWLNEAVQLFEKNQLKIFIDSVYKFEDFDKAFDRVKSNQATGKVIVQL